MPNESRYLRPKYISVTLAYTEFEKIRKLVGRCQLAAFNAGHVAKLGLQLHW